MKYFYFLLTIITITLVVTCSNISAIRNNLVAEPSTMEIYYERIIKAISEER